MVFLGVLNGIWYSIHRCLWGFFIWSPRFCSKWTPHQLGYDPWPTMAGIYPKRSWPKKTPPITVTVEVITGGLVVYEPLCKIYEFVKWDDDVPNMMGKIIQMFQSTNQIIFHRWYSFLHVYCWLHKILIKSWSNNIQRHHHFQRHAEFPTGPTPCLTQKLQSWAPRWAVWSKRCSVGSGRVSKYKLLSM